MAGGSRAASESGVHRSLGDNPEQVVDSIELSKATFGKTKQESRVGVCVQRGGHPHRRGRVSPSRSRAPPSVAGDSWILLVGRLRANSLLLRLTSRKLSKMDDGTSEAPEERGGGSRGETRARGFRRNA